ncbi:hypothetical protein M404DRAFT_591284 [Pisolithus tinctorius Marx 270]|uniref:Uncharacterized protein n=1 Tax=Pisolithus tinctorius Marx 270 TaxID=870435 RepID=A0A0C3JX36_PISTI|nr:hypothetical protein M404DRAFT_591284 [Pisolithus tinctorius Marx 270]
MHHGDWRPAQTFADVRATARRSQRNQIVDGSLPLHCICVCTWWRPRGFDVTYVGRYSAVIPIAGVARSPNLNEPGTNKRRHFHSQSLS